MAVAAACGSSVDQVRAPTPDAAPATQTCALRTVEEVPPGCGPDRPLRSVAGIVPTCQTAADCAGAGHGRPPRSRHPTQGSGRRAEHELLAGPSANEARTLTPAAPRRPRGAERDEKVRKIGSPSEKRERARGGVTGRRVKSPGRGDGDSSVSGGGVTFFGGSPRASARGDSSPVSCPRVPGCPRCYFGRSNRTAGGHARTASGPKRMWRGRSRIGGGHSADNGRTSGGQRRTCPDLVGSAADAHAQNRTEGWEAAVGQPGVKGNH
jgi:hypothetical protein